MAFDALFVLNSILFGIGLAMDAFSVSIANGLNEPEMPVSRGLVIAGTFAVFQTVMPLLGWFCIHSIEEAFQAFQPWIPWIALGLLVFIGVRMILEGLRPKEEKTSLKGGALFIQGVATSIDALSVGFAIAEYTPALAVIESVIIGISSTSYNLTISDWYSPGSSEYYFLEDLEDYGYDVSTYTYSDTEEYRIVNDAPEGSGYEYYNLSFQTNGGRVKDITLLLSQEDLH